MLYKDPTKSIFKSLYETLSGITGVTTYSFVPNNKENPYIFIGDIQLIENKVSCFILSGTLTVELFTGTNKHISSLSDALDIATDIKYRMKNDKGSILNLKPSHKMIYMRMVNDSGLENISETEKLYIDSIQYEFELQQLPGYMDRVDSAGGIVESPNCIPFEYR